jgi:F0F1-type ATP synthase epsilon subunit
MELTIVSPSYKKTVKIAWLEIETTVGNFVIQPGYAPTTLVLAPNSTALFSVDNNTQESIPVVGGIADINRTSATLVLMQ